MILDPVGIRAMDGRLPRWERGLATVEWKRASWPVVIAPLTGFVGSFAHPVRSHSETPPWGLDGRVGPPCAATILFGTLIGITSIGLGARSRLAGKEG